ncbi:hypothetical protein ACFQL7_20555 [Halocatena marina]|uniref:Uncharacterized protein n=1 Tax=Halocatena marina TaxID=2934937 RepID=A0ABD5YR47_9EURY|nr:hypothetical protein [Halocatena marina]
MPHIHGNTTVTVVKAMSINRKNTEKSIEQFEFFDERYDEVLSEDEHTAVVVFGYDVFGSNQIKEYRKQDEWKLDIISIQEGELWANFERLESEQENVPEGIRDR